MKTSSLHLLVFGVLFVKAAAAGNHITSVNESQSTSPSTSNIISTILSSLLANVTTHRVTSQISPDAGTRMQEEEEEGHEIERESSDVVASHSGTRIGSEDTQYGSPSSSAEIIHDLANILQTSDEDSDSSVRDSSLNSKERRDSRTSTRVNESSTASEDSDSSVRDSSLNSKERRDASTSSRLNESSTASAEDSDSSVRDSSLNSKERRDASTSSRLNESSTASAEDSDSSVRDSSLNSKERRDASSSTRVDAPSRLTISTKGIATADPGDQLKNNSANTHSNHTDSLDTRDNEVTSAEGQTGLPQVSLKDDRVVLYDKNLDVVLDISIHLNKGGQDQKNDSGVTVLNGTEYDNYDDYDYNDDILNAAYDDPQSRQKILSEAKDTSSEGGFYDNELLINQLSEMLRQGKEPKKVKRQNGGLWDGDRQWGEEDSMFGDRSQTFDGLYDIVRHDVVQLLDGRSLEEVVKDRGTMKGLLPLLKILRDIDAFDGKSDLTMRVHQNMDRKQNSEEFYKKDEKFPPLEEPIKSGFELHEAGVGNHKHNLKDNKERVLFNPGRHNAEGPVNERTIGYDTTDSLERIIEEMKSSDVFNDEIENSHGDSGSFGHHGVHENMSSVIHNGFNNNNVNIYTSQNIRTLDSNDNLEEASKETKNIISDFNTTKAKAEKVFGHPHTQFNRDVNKSINNRDYDSIERFHQGGEFNLTTKTPLVSEPLNNVIYNANLGNPSLQSEDMKDIQLTKNERIQDKDTDMSRENDNQKKPLDIGQEGNVNHKESHNVFNDKINSESPSSKKVGNHSDTKTGSKKKSKHTREHKKRKSKHSHSNEEEEDTDCDCSESLEQNAAVSDSLKDLKNASRYESDGDINNKTDSVTKINPHSSEKTTHAGEETIEGTTFLGNSTHSQQNVSRAGEEPTEGNTFMGNSTHSLENTSRAGEELAEDTARMHNFTHSQENTTRAGEKLTESAARMGDDTTAVSSPGLKPFFKLLSYHKVTPVSVNGRADLLGSAMFETEDNQMGSSRKGFKRQSVNIKASGASDSSIEIDSESDSDSEENDEGSEDSDVESKESDSESKDSDDDSEDSKDESTRKRGNKVGKDNKVNFMDPIMLNHTFNIANAIDKKMEAINEIDTSEESEEESKVEREDSEEESEDNKEESEDSDDESDRKGESEDSKGIDNVKDRIMYRLGNVDDDDNREKARGDNTAGVHTKGKTEGSELHSVKHGIMYNYAPGNFSDNDENDKTSYDANDGETVGNDSVKRNNDDDKSGGRREKHDAEKDIPKNRSRHYKKFKIKKHLQNNTMPNRYVKIKRIHKPRSNITASYAPFQAIDLPNGNGFWILKNNTTQQHNPLEAISSSFPPGGEPADQNQATELQTPTFTSPTLTTFTSLGTEDEPAVQGIVITDQQSPQVEFSIPDVSADESAVPNTAAIPQILGELVSASIGERTFQSKAPELLSLSVSTSPNVGIGDQPTVRSIATELLRSMANTSTSVGSGDKLTIQSTATELQNLGKAVASGDQPAVQSIVTNQQSQSMATSTSVVSENEPTVHSKTTPHQQSQTVAMPSSDVYTDEHAVNSITIQPTIPSDTTLSAPKVDTMSVDFSPVIKFDGSLTQNFNESLYNQPIILNIVERETTNSTTQTNGSAALNESVKAPSVAKGQGLRNNTAIEIHHLEDFKSENTTDTHSLGITTYVPTVSIYLSAVLVVYVLS